MTSEELQKLVRDSQLELINKLAVNLPHIDGTQLAIIRNSLSSPSRIAQAVGCTSHAIHPKKFNPVL